MTAQRQADPKLPEAIRAHAAYVWPEAAVDIVRWEQDGIRRNLPDLAIVRVAPPASGGPWIHLTAGASIDPMEDGYGLEFLLAAPADEPLAVKLLSMVVELQADPRYPLHMGQVLEIGQPWLPGASCDHLLVTLPGAFDPELEWLTHGERRVRFVWLVPITAAEAAFGREKGFVALQERLGAAGVDPVALVRASAI
jgi:hypothetical protein